MNKFNRYIVLIALFFLSMFQGCFHFTRVIKKDEKSPIWINSLSNNYIVATGTGYSCEEAEQNVLINLRKKIIEQLPIDITRVSNSKLKYSMINAREEREKEIIEILEEYSSTFGFIDAISLEKCDDYYWEKVIKGGNVLKCKYYVKYPFSNSDRENLIRHWQKRYFKIRKKVQALLNKKYYSISEMRNDVIFFKKLLPALDSMLRREIKIKIEELSNYLHNAYIVIEKNRPRYLDFSIIINNRTFSCGIKPILKNNCIDVISALENRGVVSVEYNYKDCFFHDQDNNLAIIEIPINDNFSIKREIRLTLPYVADKGINILGPIFTEETRNSLYLDGVRFNVKIRIKNRSMVPVIIYDISVIPYGAKILFFSVKGTKIQSPDLLEEIGGNDVKDIIFPAKKFSTAFYSKYNKANVVIHYRLITNDVIKEAKFNGSKFAYIK